MMWRLFAWVLSSILLSVVVTSAAIAYGQRQLYLSPLPPLGYDVCDGVPCYLGIVSGLTSWSEAKDHIPDFQQRDVDDSAATLKWFTTTDVSGYIITGNNPTSESDFVTETVVMSLNPTAPFPTLLDVLLFYGTPCNVLTEDVLGSVTLIRLNYPHLSIDLPRVTDRLTLDRRPETINFKSAQSDQCTDISGVQAWRGLTYYQRYLRQ